MSEWEELEVEKETITAYQKDTVRVGMMSYPCTLARLYTLG